MNPLEFTVSVLVILVLVGLAVFFGWRQVLALKRLARQKDLTREDQLYFKQQAHRRLIGSLLMLVLAGLLIGSFYLDREYREVTHQAKEKSDTALKMQPEEKDFLNRFTIYWIVSLGVLFVFALFAALDIRANLRYGFRHHRRLRDEHRAALEEQVRRYRQQRNGAP